MQFECHLVCIHLESLSFLGSLSLYIQGKDAVSNVSLIFKALVILLWSAWFIWYYLSSSWSLLILSEWAEQFTHTS